VGYQHKECKEGSHFVLPYIFFAKSLEGNYRRVLSLDGGGVRGLSSLLILREIMEEIGRQVSSNETPSKTPLPCEYFDLIGGSGTGGLIAIMLGRLRMVNPVDKDDNNVVCG
jgi:patatin-like phospholipase/acyl hydrolase